LAQASQVWQTAAFHPAMKCFRALVCALAVPATGFNEIQFDNPHDAGKVMEQLQGMMGAAKLKLSMAEAHHTKVVNKARKKTEKFLASEAETMGTAVGRYGLELQQAEYALQLALDSAKADLKKAEAEPTKPSDWRDPIFAQKARLGAQVGAAERALKKAERKRGRLVREAEDRVEEPIEEQAQKLSMKLGDLTPEADKAKQSLEAGAEALMANKTAGGASHTSLVDTTSGKAMDYLVKDGGKLEAALKQMKGAVASAGKRFDAYLVNATKDVTAKTANVTEYLDKAQQREIARVLGRPVPSLKSQAKRHH